MTFESRLGGSGYGRVVPAGEGTLLELAGWRMLVKVGASDTGGAVTILEGELAPGHRGPIHHVHTGHDEAFFILQGSLRFRLGAASREVVEGETVFASRGLAHGFANDGDRPVRYLAVLSPSGFEFYFARLAALIRQQGSMPDRATLLRLMAEHATYPVDQEGSLSPA